MDNRTRGCLHSWVVRSLNGFQVHDTSIRVSSSETRGDPSVMSEHSLLDKKPESCLFVMSRALVIG